MTQPAAAIRILLVDDHPILRIGLAALISTRSDMVTVAQAGSGEEAIRLHQQQQPDITLMDLRLPGISGVDTIRAIRARAPNARFIVLTTYEGDEDIHQAIQAGAMGYIIKGMPHEMLVDALTRVHAGGRFLPPTVRRTLAARTPSADLTTRERDVLIRIAQGKSNKEIAAHQHSPKAWKSLAHAALRQAVFAYTRDTIAAFRNANLMPDMVQIGNEVTSGMLWPDGQLPDHWERFADLIAAGIQGVDAASTPANRPRIMIHIDQGGNSETTQWFFDHLDKFLAGAKVHYDIIGQSYYPWWQGSLDDLGKNLRFIARTYHKDTMVVETAYDWKPGESFDGKKKPFPETPEGQRDFLRALATVVRDPANHCLGLFWWEPAAEGAIAKRSFFDDEHKALPVVTAFDAPTSP